MTVKGLKDNSGDTFFFLSDFKNFHVTDIRMILQLLC